MFDVFVIVSKSLFLRNKKRCKTKSFVIILRIRKVIRLTTNISHFNNKIKIIGLSPVNAF